MAKAKTAPAGPTEYPIGDVPGLTLADVLAVAQAGYRTAADLHRAAFERAKARHIVDASKSRTAMRVILIGVFGGDVVRAARVADAIRAETHRRLAAFNGGA